MQGTLFEEKGSPLPPKTFFGEKPHSRGLKSETYNVRGRVLRGTLFEEKGPRSPPKTFSEVRAPLARAEK